jgi:hypothetical protein
MDVYRINLEPVPNWFSHASLAGLLTVLPPVAAEKVFLTIFVLALLASFRYVLASFRPEAGGAFGLVVPFVYDAALHLGYYNRAFAAVPFLLALGYWTRRDGRLGPRGALTLAALLLWLYFCAAVALVLAVLGLGVLLVGVTVAERGQRPTEERRVLLHRAVALAAAALPALLLLVRFRAREGGNVVGPGPGFWERLRPLATLELLVSLDPRERWVAAALAAVLVIALSTLLVRRFRRRTWRRSDALLALSLACAAGYFLSPMVGVEGHGPSGGTVHDRIAPFVWLVLLVWLGAEPLERTTRRFLLSAAIGLGLALGGLRLPRYAELNDHLREYESAAAWVPEGTTFVAVGYAHQGLGEDGRSLAHATWPFRHAADRIVPARGAVNADNYEAEVEFFPVAYRGGYDAYELLGSTFDRMPACVRLGRFNRLAPHPAESVLVWNARWDDRGDPCTDELARILETRYRRVFTSAPRGRMEVFRRVGSPGTGASP